MFAVELCFLKLSEDAWESFRGWDTIYRTTNVNLRLSDYHPKKTVLNVTTRKKKQDSMRTIDKLETLVYPWGEKMRKDEMITSNFFKSKKVPDYVFKFTLQTQPEYNLQYLKTSKASKKSK